MNVTDHRAESKAGDVQALDMEAGSRDVVVSALVLNFVPDKEQALSEMLRVTRAGGTVGFYVWDYPGRGVEFMRAFWDAEFSSIRTFGTSQRIGGSPTARLMASPISPTESV